MSTFLIERNGRFDGPLFSSVPSPKNITDKLHMGDALSAMEDKQNESDDENELISSVDRTLAQQAPDHTSKHKDASSSAMTNSINRSVPGFITHLVGDVGTCKTNKAVMSHACAYSWIGICMGDMHNKGYFCEACFKEHGQSELHYIVLEVLKRKKLTTEAFKSKKFQENFLTQVREAIHDVCLAYCIAAFLEFRETAYFPSNSELACCVRSTGNHSGVILSKFKEWLKTCSAADASFNHHSSAFLYHGPLMKLYDDCIRYGDGQARETVYKLQVPTYAQLGFKNYFQETFRHVINIYAKWPEVARNILQDNCYVNVSGKDAKGIEMDAYAESEVVRPLKVYSSGHTTVKMCERVMGNINLLKSIRSAYKSPESFDVHHTLQHSEQSPFPDQLKATWFCLNKQLFVNKGKKEIAALPIDRKGQFDGKLSNKVVNVYDKSVQIIKDNFKTKIYDCFPDLRYRILTQ